jgi:DNA-binding transcriptional LysR family regulator
LPLACAGVLQWAFGATLAVTLSARQLQAGRAFVTLLEDAALPRRIGFWRDDLQLLIALLRSGQALAYLPGFALTQHQDLARLSVPDCPCECVERVHGVWRPGTASG